MTAVHEAIAVVKVAMDDKSDRFVTFFVTGRSSPVDILYLTDVIKGLKMGL